MVDYTKMDQMEQELFEKHSLTALVYLIECGRELEFEVHGHTCFLSKYETSQNFSLWVDQKEQSFSSMAALLKRGQVHNAGFVSVWEKSKIITLF